MSNPPKTAVPELPDAMAVLRQTNKVGQEVRTARHELAATDATVNIIRDLLELKGEENPVLEAIKEVLLMLRHQQAAIDSIDRMLESIERHVGARRPLPQ